MEIGMSVAAAKSVPHSMTAGEFRNFQATRPDHERWELIRGIAVMMTPPTIAHNRIAGNLERLLNDALSQRSDPRIANQRPGVELGRVGDDFRPEPDVAVIDADYAPGQRFVERAYLLAEVLSSSDYELVPDLDEPWMIVKRRLYLEHRHCEAVLMIEQDRVEIRVDRRVGEDWTSTTLKSAADELVLDEFGLRCRVAELYQGTPLGR
jgi:Uma2 family endonuclease